MVLVSKIVSYYVFKKIPVLIADDTIFREVAKKLVKA